MAGPAQNKTKPRIGDVTAIMIMAFALGIDALKFVLTFVPGLDVAFDWFLWFLGFCTINLWVALIIGPGFLFSGKNAGKKIAVTMATAVVGLIPLIDGLIPELLIEAVGLILLTRSEDLGMNLSNMKVTSPTRALALARQIGRRTSTLEPTPPDNSSPS